MNFKFFITFISILIVVSCSNPNNDNTNSKLSFIEGIVADKSNNNQNILVIPNLDQSDIEGKDLNELFILAEENKGIYFYVSNEEFENYNIGDQVSVEYDIEGNVEESNPPIRSAVNIRSLD